MDMSGDTADLAAMAARAAAELGIGTSEWRWTGDRAAVSMLLHVQIPALAVAAGVEPTTDPANAVAVDREARRLAVGDVHGPLGPLDNLGALRRMAAWSAPWCPVAASLLPTGGPLESALRRSGGPA